MLCMSQDSDVDNGHNMCAPLTASPGLEHPGTYYAAVSTWYHSCDYHLPRSVGFLGRCCAAPATSRLGLCTMLAQAGMWRSAAVWL